jgi:hypothetical protein
MPRAGEVDLTGSFRIFRSSWGVSRMYEVMGAKNKIRISLSARELRKYALWQQQQMGSQDQLSLKEIIETTKRDLAWAGEFSRRIQACTAKSSA